MTTKTDTRELAVVRRWMTKFPDGTLGHVIFDDDEAWQLL